MQKMLVTICYDRLELGFKIQLCIILQCLHHVSVHLQCMRTAYAYSVRLPYTLIAQSYSEHLYRTPTANTYCRKCNGEPISVLLRGQKMQKRLTNRKKQVITINNTLSTLLRQPQKNWQSRFCRKCNGELISVLLGKNG